MASGSRAAACALVCAVADLDHTEVARILGGLDHDRLATVATVLAAMVPDDTVVDEARTRAAVRLVQPCVSPRRVITDVASTVSERLGVPVDRVYSRAGLLDYAAWAYIGAHIARHPAATPVVHRVVGVQG